MALKPQRERSTEETTTLWQRRWVQIVGVALLILIACVVIETVLGSGASPKATSSSPGVSLSDPGVTTATAGGAGAGKTDHA